jgi:hypothetical protein
MRLTKVCRSSRGRPAAVYAGDRDRCSEFAADVGGVEFAAVAGGEHRPGGPVLALLQVGEGGGGQGGQGAGFFGADAGASDRAT